MPADRQAHVRVIGGDGVIERTVAVEPMTAMHYVTISVLHKSYCVEFGYFQSFDTWHSVATGDEIEIPPLGRVGVAEVDLGTIPFHLSFQQLAHRLGAATDTPVAKVVSEFENRVLGTYPPNKTTRSDMQILRDLNLSLREQQPQSAILKRSTPKSSRGAPE